MLTNCHRIGKETRSTVIGMVGAILWWVHFAVGTETLLSISMSVQCTLYFRIRSPFYGQLFAVTGVCSSRSVPHQNWFLKPSVPDLQILIHPHTVWLTTRNRTSQTFYTVGNKISLEEFETPTRRLEPKQYVQVSSMGEKTSKKSLPVFESWAEANFLHTHVLQVQKQRIGTQKHTILRGWDCVCNLSAGFNFPKSDESWVVGNGLTNQLGTLGFSLQCATLHNRTSAQPHN